MASSTIQSESNLESTRELVGTTQLALTVKTDPRPWILAQGIWDSNGAWWIDSAWKNM